jgi:hypothetical protein
VNSRSEQSSNEKATPSVVVHSITDAQVGLTQDQSGRQRRYFISMMIRTFCFILAVVLPHPYRWFALVGAVTLPYIAVVVANAGRETIRSRRSSAPDLKALEG